MEKTHTKFRLINLNNKSRKGTYIEIRDRYKRKHMYRFYDKPYEIEATLNYMKSSKTKAQNISRKKYIDAYSDIFLSYTKGDKLPKQKSYAHRQAMQILRKIRSAPDLSSVIRSGYSSVNIPNVHAINVELLKQKLRELFQQQIMKESYLDSILQSSNLNKLRNNFDYDVTIKNSLDEVITKGYKHGGQPIDIFEEIKRNIKIDENYNLFVNRLKGRGYTVEPVQVPDDASRVELSITFRRA